MKKAQDNICINCKKIPIAIKKHSLCLSCYQVFYRQGRIKTNKHKLDNEKGLSYHSISKHEHLGELEFIKNFFDHSNWFPQPANFYLNGKKYTPDIYDGERNVWIEVSRTRQAYSANKHKYDLFRKLYPKLNFEIRKPTGEILNEDLPIHSQLKDI